MNPIHIERYRQLSLKIGYYRRRKGMTQEELAERIHKNTAFLAAAESPNINKTVSLDTLFDIADALGVAPHRFLQYDED